MSHESPKTKSKIKLWSVVVGSLLVCGAAISLLRPYILSESSFDPDEGNFVTSVALFYADHEEIPPDATVESIDELAEYDRRFYPTFMMVPSHLEKDLGDGKAPDRTSCFEVDLEQLEKYNFYCDHDSESLVHITTNEVETAYAEKALHQIRAGWRNGLASYLKVPRKYEHASLDVLASRLQELTGNSGSEARQIEERLFGALALTHFKPDPQKVSRFEAGLGVFELQAKLRKIGLAMHVFHDNYNRFPTLDSSPKVSARSIRGVEVKSRHLSWRVALLPYIKHADLYKKFRQDEPWDSPHNKKLIGEMPDLFKTPGVSEAGHTSFELVVCKEFQYRAEHVVTFRDVKRIAGEGYRDLLMAVLAGADKRQPWTKPSAIEFERGTGVSILGQQVTARGFPYVTFGGESNKFIPNDATGEQLEAVIRPGSRE